MSGSAATAFVKLHLCDVGVRNASSSVHGNLGDGTFDDSSVPVPVAGGHTFTSMATAHAHTCAIDADGQLYCWGENGSGQLGTGNQASSAVPVLVSEPM